MPKPRPSPLSAILRFFRWSSGWSSEELAQALGVHPALISGYERGVKALSRERLEELLAPLETPPEAIDSVLYALEVASFPESPGSPVDPRPAELRLIHEAMAVAGRKAVTETRRKMTEKVRRERAAQARRRAGTLWKDLQGMAPPRRREAVEAERKYWTWALAERLCAESVRAAAHRADGALELAGLALRVAELAPGGEAWSSRLQGYAWAFVGNARRVQGDLPRAEEAFVRSDRLWEAGAAADPGVLDASRVLDLKASLRRQQGRYEEALTLLDKALAASPTREARSRILVMKATTLTRYGDCEQAVDVLQQAEHLTDGTMDLRLPWLIRFTLTLNLWQLKRYAEAAARLSEIRELAARLGNELDLVRVLWLEGRVVAGLGQRDEALLALGQVRRYFTMNQIAYDAALASLEVAVLYLEQGRTREVKRLAEEMLWIFKGQGVHQEALAALRLFYEAARKEEASADLARRLVQYLLKARDNPGLRFDAQLP
jgi:tetratricopeptide (TPR) repeat protein